MHGEKRFRIESRPAGAIDWGVRNWMNETNHLLHDKKLSILEARAKAEELLARWQLAEPTTWFRIRFDPITPEEWNRKDPQYVERLLDRHYPLERFDNTLDVQQYPGSTGAGKGDVQTSQHI